MRWNHWASLVIGLWSVVAPWVLGFASLNLVVWNSIMIGGLIIIFTLWNLAPPEE